MTFRFPRPRSAATLCAALAVLALPEPGISQVGSGVGQEEIEAPDTLRLGLLLDQDTPSIRGAASELIAEIVAVVGGRAVVEFDETAAVVVGFDAEEARRGYDQLVAGQADIVLAFGTGLGSAMAARSSFPVPTILFGTFISDAADLPSVGETSGVENFTFLVTVRSWQSDLEAFADLVDFRRLGILVPEAMRALVPSPADLDRLLAPLDATWRIVPFEGGAGLEGDLREVDAVYLPETLSIGDADVAAIADALVGAGIPSFSGSRREDVELGIMATTRSPQDRERLLRRIALHVEAVVEGDDLADRPVLVELEDQLALNLYTARAVGLPIRIGLLGEAELVGRYENVRAERTYTLAGLVEEALSANLALEVARGDVRLGELERRSGWSAFLPDVGARLTSSAVSSDLASAAQGQNPQYTTQGTLSVAQVLYSPAAVAGLSILESQLEGRRDALRTSEWNLIREVADAYFAALVLKANAEVQSRNLDATNRNLRVAEENHAAGQTGLADVLRLRSESAREKQALVAAVTRVRQAFHRINQLVDQPIDREIDVTDLEYADGNFADDDFERVRIILDDPLTQEIFQDWAVAEALARSPELASLDHTIDALERRAGLYGAERFLPTVTGGLDLVGVVDRSGVGAPPSGVFPDRYWSLGVSAAVPLFESNRNRVERQVAQVQARQLRLERDLAASQIEQATRDVVVSLVRTMTDIELSTISEETAAESLVLAQQAYATGAISIVDLLDTQANSLQAQLARVSATYTFLNTSVVLQRLTGNFLLLGGDEARRALLDRFDAYRAGIRQDSP